MTIQFHRRRGRQRLAAAFAGIVTLFVALSGCSLASTSAAYTDQAHARTEDVTARIELPFRMGLSATRSLETAAGLGSDGNAYVWGRTNMRIAGTKPGGTWQGATKVGGLPEGAIVSITGQPYNFNALQENGQVWGWGEYPVRDGTGVQRPDGRPERLRINSNWNGTGAVLTGMTAIATSEMAGAGLRDDGSVWSWGAKVYGGSEAMSGAQLVGGLPDPNANNGEHFPVAIFGGYRNFWVLLNSGEVWHWGSTSSTPAGDLPAQRVARKSTALAPWFKNAVAEGEPYVVRVGGGIDMGNAVLSNGRVLTWGVGVRIGDRPVPPAAGSPGLVPEAVLSGIVDSASGFTGAVFLSDQGELYGFGASDDYGGNPTTPTLLDSDVVDFTAGQGYYIWRKHNGEFWGKGYNSTGAIGSPAGPSLRKLSLDLSAIS